MLQSMRSYSRSAVAVLMFLFLILTFGAWGIGDIFRNRTPDPVVADVAGTEIHAAVLRQRFNQQLEQLQRTTGTTIPLNQAIALNFHRRILEGEIQQLMRDRLSKDYGLVISDDFVRRALSQDPNFRGLGGTFDPSMYARVLQGAGMSEQTYVADLKRNAGVDELFGSMTGGIVAPSDYAELLYRYRQEKRVADTAVVSFASIKNVRMPSDEELKTYYEANKSKFVLPEYRKLNFIYVKADDVLGEIAVTPDKLREEYEIRLNEFTTPETRDIDQVVLDSEDKANALADAVQKGKAFDAAAKEVLGRDNAVIKLGVLKKTDLPAGLADPAFDLKPGVVSRPIRTALGWHVLLVNKIEAKTVKPFDAVKAELEQAIKKQQAPDRLLSLSADLEKQLNRGASLEDAAARLGVKVQTIDAVDASGAAPSGTPAAGLPDAKKFLPLAFSQRKGEESGIEEIANGDFFVLRVADVTPSRTPELAETKNKAVAAWQQDETVKLATKKAEEIVTKLNSGTTFAAVVRADNLEVKTAGAVTRTTNDPSANLPPELVNKLFTLKPGAAASGAMPNGVAIAVLKDVTPADPAKDKPGVDKLTAELQQAMRGEVLTAFDNILRRRYTIKVDEAVLAQTFPVETR
ncbi:MAG: peptidyl-prolyl cis-trans isomerase [Rhodospirillales bacterium]